jgi:hypothetical protein
MGAGSWVRRTWVAAAAAGVVFSLASSASASLLFYDGFNYTINANLKDQPGWAEPGGSTDQTLDKINAGSLAFPLHAASGNSVRTGGKYSYDSYLGIPPDQGFGTIEGSTAWFSFLLQRQNAGNGGTTDPDYGGLVIGSSGNKANNLFVGKPGAGSNTKYAIEAEDGSAQDPSSVDFSGDVAFLAVKITFHTGGAEDIALYVNPTPGAAENTLTANANTQVELSLFNDWHISTGVNAVWLFDELMIGTSYADVSPVPEPTAGLLAISAAALTVSSRQRRTRRS